MNKTKKIALKNNNEFVNETEYKYLIEHLKAIITMRRRNAKREVILTYAEIGKEIWHNPLYKKYQKDNRQFILQIASDVGVSERMIYWAIEFYEKCLLFYEEQLKQIGDICTVVQTFLNNIFGENAEDISFREIRYIYLSPLSQLKEIEGEYKEIEVICPKCKGTGKIIIKQKIK
jgi:hypothetical protein